MSTQPMIPLEKRSTEQLKTELVQMAIIAGPLAKRRSSDQHVLRHSMLAMYDHAQLIRERAR